MEDVTYFEAYDYEDCSASLGWFALDFESREITFTQWDSTLLPVHQGRRIFYIEAYNSQYPSITSTCYVSIIVTIECNESVVLSNLDTSTMQFRNQAG